MTRVQEGREAKLMASSGALDDKKLTFISESLLATSLPSAVKLRQERLDVIAKAVVRSPIFAKMMKKLGRGKLSQHEQLEIAIKAATLMTCAPSGVTSLRPCLLMASTCLGRPMSLTLAPERAR